MKYSLKAITFLIFIAIVSIISGSLAMKSPGIRGYFISTVSAEDDEGEREGEDDYQAPVTTQADPVLSTGSSTTVQTKQVIQNVIEYKSVTKTVTVTDEEYRIDSDGDGLVDAIDPNPTIKQSEFFTDIDGDGVPNAFDLHHDEDDFAYFDDAETDMNSNGILDSYEQ